MSKYCTLNDAIDPSLLIEQHHLDDADIFLDAELIKLGFVPDDLILPQSVLIKLASLYALKLACLEQTIGEDTQILHKEAQYQKLIDSLLESLSANGLGVIDSNVGIFVDLI